MLTEDDPTMPDNHQSAPILSAILAMDQNGLIGDHGNLPWHLPADLQHFKKTTLNHVVIMGRKTYLSIGKPLPHRTNIILTHDASFTAKDCLIAHSREEAISLAKKVEPKEMFIIGGAEIYQTFMSLIKRFYITEIAHTFTGDAYFTWHREEWREISRDSHEPDEKNRYPYSFMVFERR